MISERVPDWKARIMHTTESNAETRLWFRLVREGIQARTMITIPLATPEEIEKMTDEEKAKCPKTVPDLYIPRDEGKPVLVYLDGEEVHGSVRRGGWDRLVDSKLGELGFAVVRFSYGGQMTVGELDEVVKMIRKEMK